MIDHAAHLKAEQDYLDKQQAAADSGHVINIRVEFGETWRNLVIESNHPVLINFMPPEDMGYMLHGGAVHSLPGQCPIGMQMIDDIAKQGITELRIDAGKGRAIVIPIPTDDGPNA